MKKIWGMSYGVVGDLVAALPMLTYFEKKYPNSYKYWVIEKKCSFTAPLFLNHPLIDRIKITDNWSTFGENDQKLIDECEFVARRTSKHDVIDWYNYNGMVEETFKLAGVYDMHEVLTEEEQRPKLYKWFEVGLENVKATTYSKTSGINNDIFANSVSIWPFATGHPFSGRSPNPRWWNVLIEKLNNEGISVHHYGKDSEPPLSELDTYFKRTNMSFFQQVKAALASNVVIGPDTGPMWVMGAYEHPAINLNTFYLPNHVENKTCLNPVNKNATSIFIPNRNNLGCNAIDPALICDIIVKKINNPEG